LASDLSINYYFVLRSGLYYLPREPHTHVSVAESPLIVSINSHTPFVQPSYRLALAFLCRSDSWEFEGALRGQGRECVWGGTN